MTILVTGAAGFIGFHVATRLLERGEAVLGIDNLNPYYDVTLKAARLERLRAFEHFAFAPVDIADRAAVAGAVAAHRDEITGVVHLAAQAGVRYSLENPFAYVDANVMGHVVLLEAAREFPRLESFVYASSSSVYGANSKLPFSVDDPVDTPVSLYAASKRSCELIAQTYAGLHGLRLTGLRFFTVYGPWGRPDMAAWLFCEAIAQGKPIAVFNNGEMLRDFTFIDDIVSGTVAALDRPPATGTGIGGQAHRIYNLGNHRPERLMDFIAILERAWGREAVKDWKPMQPGDVPATFADIDASRRDLGFEPRTTLEEGLPRFVEWYRSRYGGAVSPG